MKSKEALRRYKKVQASSSSSSSDSDSSYSSSDSERKHHHKKKGRTARRSSSSSDDERRKREKREHCHKKLEAKRNHLKRKLKEAKLKKRAAAAAAALSGHSHRALSPATQAKLKKLAERKHQRAASKERREREREKQHRAAAREREREREHHRLGSRSPTKITKIRIHQDVKRQKSPPPRMHHQLMSREKIIIQTRTRERTPSSAERDRQRHEHSKRHHEELLRERRDRDRDRAEREAAREKERAEALARCQQRQLERERLAREKLRREEDEKKYGGDRLPPSRPAELAMATVRRGSYGSRERSLERVRSSKQHLEVYDRERDYLAVRRRDLSPVPSDHYNGGGGGRVRDPRDLYLEEEPRDHRAYSRPYAADEARHAREGWIDTREQRAEMHDLCDFREIERDLLYADERDRLLRDRERTLSARGGGDCWKGDWEATPLRDREWQDGAPAPTRNGFVGGPKRGPLPGSGGAISETLTKPPPAGRVERRAPSEPDWDAEKQKDDGGKDETTGYSTTGGSRGLTPREKKHGERRCWTGDWPADDEDAAQRAAVAGATSSSSPILHHRSERGGRSAYRRGGSSSVDGERSGPGGSSSYRPHPPPLMTLPVQPPGGFHGAVPPPRFPSKRNMTYTNPNLLKMQQAALAVAKAAAQASAVAAATTAVVAAKAAAQSSANATTTPGILGQVSGSAGSGGTAAVAAARSAVVEAGELLNGDPDTESTTSGAAKSEVMSLENNKVIGVDGGELSEISDSDDEILTKAERKPKSDSDEAAAESTATAASINDNETAGGAVVEERVDDDEMLDFEEISDGELEEDARIKTGVGDALGVDWASLIAETRRQTDTAAPAGGEEPPTSAKQMWQPHRIILERLGVSMRMAGADYAQRLLRTAQQKIDAEMDLAAAGGVGAIAVVPIKEEISSNADEDSMADDGMPPPSTTAPTIEAQQSGDTKPAVDSYAPLAFIQVAQRQHQLQRRQLVANACGANSRALSARQDLKLRRQLCGLPAQECDLPSPIPATSANLQAMALAAFQRRLAVK